jgi:hypothetical protein
LKGWSRKRRKLYSKKIEEIQRLARPKLNNTGASSTQDENPSAGSG